MHKRVVNGLAPFPGEGYIWERIWAVEVVVWCVVVVVWLAI
jgi:hypothetical protein